MSGSRADPGLARAAARALRTSLSDSVETLWSFARCRYAARPRTRAALEAQQERTLQRHLRWVLPRSAYYRERFAAVGHDPARWREIAVSDKASLMHGFTRLNTAGVERDRALELALTADRSRDFVPKLEGLTVGLSSGTSGNRGLFLASQSENNQWAGVALAKMLPGSPLDVHRIALLHRANSHLYQGLGTGRLQFRYFDLLQPWSELLRSLSAYQPSLLIAPPSALRLLAEAKTQGVLTLPAAPTRLVSVAEVLEPSDRQVIERAFGVRVDIAYVATEGFVACSCERGGLHLNEDLLVVEKDWLDRERRAFVPIITDLRRRVVPIIRYRLDDVLSLSEVPCPCGSAQLTLAAIQGRCDDAFQLGGVLVLPDFVRQAALHASPEICEYELVQRASGQIEATLALSPAGMAQADSIVRALGEQLARVCSALAVAAPELSVRCVAFQPQPISERKVRRIRSELLRTP
jgi:putative adenylate-forming enzyme